MPKQLIKKKYIYIKDQKIALRTNIKNFKCMF